jgi:hypothetical protein
VADGKRRVECHPDTHFCYTSKTVVVRTTDIATLGVGFSAIRYSYLLYLAYAYVETKGVATLSVAFLSLISNGVRYIRLDCYTWIGGVSTAGVRTLSVECNFRVV